MNNDQNSDSESKENAPDDEVKYMNNKDLMREIADLAGISSYEPSTDNREKNHTRFTKEERQKLYEEITGESAEELLRVDLPELIMKSLDEELSSKYRGDFTRPDLKKIYRTLSERKSE